MLGILLINKPEGDTSHDIVNQLRRSFGTKRVGHAGTLDPLATGLLTLAVGPATRFLQYLSLEPKVYLARYRFGQSTDTQDAEGDVLEERPVPHDLPARLEAAMASFRGEIQQLPPMYSAVKKKGQPLYKYARAGIEVEREPRTVFIHRYELLEMEGNEGEFLIECSGGTYVRTLAHDLGEVLGCGAHLVGLTRTQVGIFHLEDAVEPADATPMNLIPLKDALYPMPMMQLNENQEALVRHGNSIGAGRRWDARMVGLLDIHGRLISVAKVQGPLLQPACVLPEDALHE